MKLLSCVLTMALAGAACQSPSYRAYDSRPMIEDDTLMSVPVAKRDDINKARADHADAADRVLLAERDVEQAQERVTIARHEVDIAREEIEAAEARLDLARDSVESTREDQIETAMSNLQGVRAHLYWARTQVLLESERVDQLQAKVALAEQRVHLADAKIEHAKAKAVKDLDRSDYDSIDVHDFERCVVDQEVALKMAEIDVEAWEKKIEMRENALEDLAKAVPSSYRKGWSKTSSKEPSK